MVKAGATNANILLGVFFEAVFFGTLLVLMSKGDVSFIWPLTSLGFVLTTLAGKLILHEQVSWLRWGGVLLIMMGAGLITYTEKVLEQQKRPFRQASVRCHEQRGSDAFSARPRLREANPNCS